MSYCTATELQAKVTELATLVGAGKITTATINSWIADGDRIINSYCASSYALPFTNQTSGAEETPPLINTLSLELGSFFFFRNQDMADETRDKIWARVREILGKLQSGEQKLLDSDNNPIPMDSSQADIPWSNRTNVDPIFNMEDFESQEYDTDDYPDG